MDAQSLYESLMEHDEGESLNSYAFVRLGGSVSIQCDTICFAAWRSGNNTQLFIMDLNNRVHEDYSGDGEAIAKKDFIPYLDYLLNRSPWKDAFITKDAEKAVSSFVELDMKRPASEVSSALTAVRSGYEYNMASFWNDYRKTYPMLTEHQTLLLVNLFASKKDDGTIGARRTIGTGHSLFNGGHTLKSVVSVFNGVPCKTMSKDTAQDSGFFGCWGFFGDPYKREDNENSLYNLASVKMANKDINVFIKEWNDAAI